MAYHDFSYYTYLTVIDQVLRLGAERDVGLFHGEQCPEHSLEVDAVEAGERQVVAMEIHVAAEDGALLRQHERQVVELAAGDALEHLLPVAVVADLRDPRRCTQS